MNTLKKLSEKRNLLSKSIMIIYILGNHQSIFGQNIVDSTSYSINIQKARIEYKLTIKKILIPSIFLSYGAASLTIKPIKQLNLSTKNEIMEDHPHKSTIDNYTQFLPAAIVYGTNFFGYNGEHNLCDRSLIYTTSLLIVGATTFSIKHLVKEERPDGSNVYSFPSGHTATAFASAQFLFREYQHKNIWLALIGYPIALFTGTYRIINNKHYVGDVISGAGLGILSTEVAYWLYSKDYIPFTHNMKLSKYSISPYYRNGNIGLSLLKFF